MSVYLIGEAAGELASALATTGVQLRLVGDLWTAVAAAADAAAPARPSCCRPPARAYDQYRDFEARGEHFRALVEAL